MRQPPKFSRLGVTRGVMAGRSRRATRPFPMRFGWTRPTPPAPSRTPDVTRSRRDALAHAAVALAEVRGEDGPDAVLRLTVNAAARITGAAAALALACDGRLERFAAQGLDGCTRDTFARPDLLAAVADRLRALGRPLGPDDLDPATARTL